METLWLLFMKLIDKLFGKKEAHKTESTDDPIDEDYQWDFSGFGNDDDKGDMADPLKALEDVVGYDNTVEETMKKSIKEIITIDTFKLIADANNNDFNEIYDAFIKYAEEFEMYSPMELIQFLAQCSHESNLFKCRVENLNYSESALCSVFSKYYNKTGVNGKRSAAEDARKPETIANWVYANRMENGAFETGDGWKYRGKGFIQVTGKYNTRKFAESVGITINEALDKLMTIDGAMLSAFDFWKRNKCGVPALDDDIVAVTKIINGGVNGLEHRVKLLDSLKAVVELS